LTRFYEIRVPAVMGLEKNFACAGACPATHSAVSNYRLGGSAPSPSNDPGTSILIDFVSFHWRVTSSTCSLRPFELVTVSELNGSSAPLNEFFEPLPSRRSTYRPQLGTARHFGWRSWPRLDMRDCPMSRWRMRHDQANSKMRMSHVGECGHD
jgi:hypothetical protein